MDLATRILPLLAVLTLASPSAWAQSAREKRDAIRESQKGMGETIAVPEGDLRAKQATLAEAQARRERDASYDGDRYEYLVIDLPWLERKLHPGLLNTYGKLGWRYMGVSVLGELQPVQVVFVRPLRPE
jgi:hypothetical protein